MKNAIVTGAGLFLMACAATPPQDHVTPLEQACLRDPLDASRWEQLAAALAAEGEPERARAMHHQASSLRQHDVQQDYETLKLARTEVRQLGPALVAVVRTDADTVRLEISNGNGVAGAAARLARQLRVDGLQTVRLTNVKPFNVPQSRIEYQHAQKTMALALAQRLHLPLYQRTAGNAYADMRIVLGHDIRYLK